MLRGHAPKWTIRTLGRYAVQLREKSGISIGFAGTAWDPAEVFYSGDLSNQVTVRQGDAKHSLDPRFDLREHSPSGFFWGKDDGGAAQLSLALLADALQDDARALQLRHYFQGRVVSL